MTESTQTRPRGRRRRPRGHFSQPAAQSREFGTDVVLSVTTGRMLANLPRVHELIRWLTNQTELDMRYYNRAFLTAAYLLNEQHPALAEIVVPSDLHAPLLVRGWVISRMGLYGGVKTVQRDPTCGLFRHSYGQAAPSLLLNNAPIAAARHRAGRRIETIRLGEESLL